MTQARLLRTAAVLTAFAAIIFSGMVNSSKRVGARDEDKSEQKEECCTGPGTPANCLAAPFNGDRLQVMRWPFFRDMTDHELRAIYEYLSAIPCNPGKVIAGAPYLQNVCE
jgi:hypothetical protein